MGKPAGDVHEVVAERLRGVGQRVTANRRTLVDALADSAKSEAAGAYGLTGYPNLVFVDASGKVVARSEGEVSTDVLTQALKNLKAGKAVSLSAGASSSK